VHLWDTAGTELFVSSDTVCEVRVVRFDPSGRCFASGDTDSRLVIRTDSGDVVRTDNLRHREITDLAWRSETAFAVACEDGAVVTWDADGGFRELIGHNGIVNGVAWNVSGEFLASCGDDKTIRLWRGEQSETLTGHTNLIYGVKWNANDLLASSSADNTVRLWDVQTCACLQVLSSHSAQVYQIAFHPEGSILASGSLDFSVKFWRVPEGQLLMTLIGAATSYDLQFNRDGSAIAICGGTNLFFVPTASLFHQE
jgi:WD40 repeat protein